MNRNKGFPFCYNAVRKAFTIKILSQSSNFFNEFPENLPTQACKEWFSLTGKKNGSEISGQAAPGAFPPRLYK